MARLHFSVHRTLLLVVVLEKLVYYVSDSLVYKAHNIKLKDYVYELTNTDERIDQLNLYLIITQCNDMKWVLTLP